MKDPKTWNDRIKTSHVESLRPIFKEAELCPPIPHRLESRVYQRGNFCKAQDTWKGEKVGGPEGRAKGKRKLVLTRHKLTKKVVLIPNWNELESVG